MKIKIALTLIIGMLVSGISFSQTVDMSKIFGDWKFDRYVILDKTIDSVELRKQTKSVVLSFRSPNRFESKRQFGNTQKIVDAGEFEFGDDGHTLYQNSEEIKVLRLDATVFVMEAEGKIRMYLKRLK